jgi:hypothetical protein
MKTLLLLGSVILMATACNKSPTEHDAPVETRPAVSAVALPATPAPAEAPVPNPSGANSANGALCTKLCAISAPLKCKAAAECEQHCKQMLSLPTCSAEIVQSLNCFAKQPSASFECDENGLPSIKEGLCDAEQAKVASCLQARQNP